MAKFLEMFLNQRISTILCMLGFVVVVCAFYDLSGKLSDLTVEPLDTPNFYLLGLGILALVGAAVLAFFQEGFLDWNISRKIRKTSTGFETKFGTATICVHFGLLQTQVQLGNPKTAVILPSNDLFDDNCFDDAGIALGGYLAAHFSPKEIAELKEQRDLKLADIPAETIDDGSSSAAQSYGIGRCLYLEKSGHKLIIAAVSTKRKIEGVISEISYLHRAMHEVLNTVAENELNTIYTPVIGSGKGGVPPQIAFLSLLNAIYECVHRLSGHHFSTVHIVVFSTGDKSKSQLSPTQVRRVLRIALRLWR